MRFITVYPAGGAARWGRRTLILGFALLYSAAALAQTNLATNTQSAPLDEPVGWTTNGAIIFSVHKLTMPKTFLTNSAGRALPRPGGGKVLTNLVFDHFKPESLSHLIWTNLLAHTNGRTIGVWSSRTHPPGWPADPPIVTWDTNGLMWGWKGLTALSPCWEKEGNPGQVPVTALTRRHGYARGHSMGPDGFNKIFAGQHVFFLTANNSIVTRTVVRNVGRTGLDGKRRDYTILLFNEDLPVSIETVRVAAVTNVFSKLPAHARAPWPIFQTEQRGHVSAGLPGLTEETWKGGDSGSPNLLPLQGELVFISGRSTSGPDADMQADMDELCRLEKLNPKRYQLQWVDLSRFPSY